MFLKTLRNMFMGMMGISVTDSFDFFIDLYYYILQVFAGIGSYFIIQIDKLLPNINWDQIWNNVPHGLIQFLSYFGVIDCLIIYVNAIILRMTYGFLRGV